jgi:hypothetical protein
MSVSTIGVIATRCPTCGTVTVYVGTERVGTLSLRSTKQARRALVLLPRLATVRTGIVRLVSSGRGLVRLDALAVAR